MDTVSKEKEAAMRHYRRLQRLGKLFRCLEVAGFLLFVFWSSLRLPAAARLSGDLLCRFAVVVLSPRSVFFVGNAIILLLLYMSGQLSPSKSKSNSSSVASDDASTGTSDIYEEYFYEARGRGHFYLQAAAAAASQASAGDEEVKEKAVIYEDKTVRPEARRKECRRSRSEKMHRQRKPKPELRRSETDVGRKEEKRSSPLQDAMDVDEVDDEEFRRTIEEFIAKQTKFRREESLAIVLADEISGVACSAGAMDRCIVK